VTELEQRAAVEAEARTWLRTKFHHRARLKGAGVDCANFLIAVYSAAGLVPALKLEFYPHDWMLHQDEPKFLKVLAGHARGVPEARVGDVAMFKWGRHAAHGAIVLAWPTVIHAYLKDGMVVESDASKGELAERFAGFWRLNAFAD
jgi:cell wall-associated NlpC family hydrolase